MWETLARSLDRYEITVMEMCEMAGSEDDDNAGGIDDWMGMGMLCEAPYYRCQRSPSVTAHRSRSLIKSFVTAYVSARTAVL
jgi:hypothetical protein